MPTDMPRPEDIVRRLGEREHASLVFEVAAVTRDEMLDWIVAAGPCGLAPISRACTCAYCVAREARRG